MLDPTTLYKKVHRRYGLLNSYIRNKPLKFYIYRLSTLFDSVHFYSFQRVQKRIKMLVKSVYTHHFQSTEYLYELNLVVSFR